jgi:hypothetical protein
MESNKFKYPRTGHFAWSEGATNDDKIQYDLSNFQYEEVVISEKMDGENTTMYPEFFHARSLDSNNHPSRNYVKGIWGNIRYDIPKGWRICGENLYAKHSLYYDNLESYFMCFSIWNENNVCLNIDETLEWCSLLNIVHVPILYRGKFDLDFIRNFKIDTNVHEGFVMRLAREFHYNDFEKSVVKWVRKGHVQTDEHWSTQKITPNKLKL